jgi:RimJ/RimL family protein N-acetyltransferase
MTAFQSIRTERLSIRCLFEADIPALVAYRNLPEVCAMQLWDSYDKDKAKTLIEGMTNLEPFTANDSFQFGVELMVTGQLIGDLYFKMDEAGKQAELGYTFDPQFQGQGLATEATQALLDHAFQVVGLHRVYGITDPRNTRSIKLMQRLGMRQEAHHRKNLWFKGEWADDVVFAVLEEEWSSPT